MIENKILKSPVDKKERGSRACLVCRKRKVKCDANECFPNRCSNCVQFNIKDCVIPQPKKRKSKKIEELLKTNSFVQLVESEKVNQEEGDNISTTSSVTSENNTKYPEYVEIDIQRKYPELSSMKLNPDEILGHDVKLFGGSTDSVDWCCPFTEDVISEYVEKDLKNSSSVIIIDDLDYRYLIDAGCFRLPSEEICWTFIDCFFSNRLCQFPIIFEREFREKYKDLKHPPSLLLLQSIIYSGAKFYSQANWTKEEKLRHREKCDVLFKRAKILFDKRLEFDTLTTLQSLLLLSNCNKSRNVLNTKVDVSYVRQTLDYCFVLGIHKVRSLDPKTSQYKISLFKRLWWTIFVLDTLYSFIMGRPWSIDSVNISEIPMIEAKDLRDDLDDSSTDNDPKTLYFIYRVKLTLCIRKICESISMIIHSDEKCYESFATYLNDCDEMMREWIEQLPTSLLFKVNSENNNVYNASLSLEYYSTLLLLHRIHILIYSKCNNDERKPSYPSWGIIFKGAHMVAIISKYIMKNDYISFNQNFIPFSMNISGLMMMYHLYNKDKTVHEIAKEDIEIYLELLKEIAIYWPHASMTYYSLKSVYENKSKQSLLLNTLLLQQKMVSRYVGTTNISGEINVKERKQKDTVEKESASPLGRKTSIMRNSIDSILNTGESTTFNAPTNSIMFRSKVSDVLGKKPEIGSLNNTINKETSSQLRDNSVNSNLSQNTKTFSTDSFSPDLPSQNNITATTVPYKPLQLEIHQYISQNPLYSEPINPLNVSNSSSSIINAGLKNNEINRLNQQIPSVTNISQYPNGINLATTTQSNTYGYLDGNLRNQSVVASKLDFVMPPDLIPGTSTSIWQPEFDTSLLAIKGGNDKQNIDIDFDQLFRDLGF